MNEQSNARHIRDGFTLVEVVVAMVLLSAVLVMLAGMTFATAQRSVDLQSAGARSAVMLQEVNRLTAMEYADLAGQVGCRTLSSGADQFNTCIAVNALGSRTSRVRVLLTPARSGVAADSVVFVRSQPSTSNPFACGC